MGEHDGVYDEILPGDDAISYIESVIDEEPVKAAWACRAVLSEEDIGEKRRRRVEQLLEQTMQNPVNWKEAVLEWAESPSKESWDELMQFVRLDDLYDRLRDAYAYLRATDVEGDLLFRCIAETGMTSDVQDLVATGEVHPQTVADRAAKAGPAGGAWLVLAARAAQAREDKLGVIRWLKKAYASGTDRQMVDMFAAELWDRADEELRGMIRDQGWSPLGA